MKQVYILFLVCILQTINVHAQQLQDSLDVKNSGYVDTSVVKIYSDTAFKFPWLKLWRGVDTSLINFQVYNPIFKNSYSASNGNLGNASYSFYYKPTKNIGFDLGDHVFDAWMFNQDKVNYYEARRPYTEAFWEIGSKKENIIRVTHTQNIRKGFNFGFDGQKIKSQGFYNRQQTNNISVLAFTSYNAKNNRYRIMSNFIHNDILVYENGGVPDSAFLGAGLSGKDLITVNIPGSQTLSVPGALNKRKTNEFHFSQQLNLGCVNKSDTIKENRKYAFRIQHIFNYRQYASLYRQDNIANDPDYYRHAYDSTLTYDSLRYRNIENTFILGTLPYKLNGQVRKVNATAIVRRQDIAFYQMYKFSKNNFTQNGFDSLTYNNIGELQLNGSAGKHTWNFSYTHVFAGYNKNDFKVESSISKNFYDEKGFEKKGYRAYASLQNQEATFFQNRFQSNNYFWYADRKSRIKGKFSLTNIGGEFYHKPLAMRITTDFFLIGNYIYYNEKSIPTQYRHNFELLSVNAEKIFKLWKFRFNTRVIYQHSTNTLVLRIPEIMAREALYYEGRLFKGTLFSQIGFDINYFSSFNSMDYSPALAQYYLSSQTTSIGNYPYIDFFINAQISQARIFFKIDHLNSGLLGNTYYTVAHYPMADRSFKVGISWKFYN